MAKVPIRFTVGLSAERVKSPSTRKPPHFSVRQGLPLDAPSACLSFDEGLSLSNVGRAKAGGDADSTHNNVENQNLSGQIKRRQGSPLLLCVRKSFSIHEGCPDRILSALLRTEASQGMPRAWWYLRG